jgi:hypothetical protein
VPDVKPLRLSEEINRLVAAFAERPVRLREILEITRGRGYMMLLALLALPFCTPIPLPGLSTPFGVAIALIGFRLLLREKIWFPERLLDTEMSPKFFPEFLSATRRLVRGMEYFLKPRWTWLLDTDVLHHAYGAIILACGALLLLPLPIPFSNALPALTVVFLAAAMLERDGYFVIAGLIVFAVTLGYFGLLASGGAAIAHWLHP